MGGSSNNSHYVAFRTIIHKLWCVGVTDKGRGVRGYCWSLKNPTYSVSPETLTKEPAYRPIIYLILKQCVKTIVACLLSNDVNEHLRGMFENLLLASTCVGVTTLELYTLLERAYEDVGLLC